MLGVIVGVAGTLAFQRLHQLRCNGGPEALADRMTQHIEELEARLDESQAETTGQ
ncbi:MAG: hypothetical protein UZ18_ATM001000543 [Armatimonadetes bacterium OLB18]|nr:MAG: hypothetical protein UZ18_ATM001000543 [Armatimonadetes bacterium OLB18]MBV6489745.1 hypothetical protein [Fimbriimonadaceae bacterium]